MINVETFVNARRKAELPQGALAKLAGVSQQTIGEIEAGRVRSSKAIYRIAAALGVTANHLDPDVPHNPDGGPLVPVIGYVGAGAAVYAYDDHSKGAGLDEVPAPLNAGPSVVALRVRGDSMVPAYRDGDLIFYDERCAGDPAHLIGKDCVIALTDGRILLKELRIAGGSYWLHSHNADPILHPQIEWIARVQWVTKT